MACAPAPVIKTARGRQAILQAASANPFELSALTLPYLRFGGQSADFPPSFLVLEDKHIWQNSPCD
jgi:hypothetical protein